VGISVVAVYADSCLFLQPGRRVADVTAAAPPNTFRKSLLSKFFLCSFFIAFRFGD
jgi:hypothetical protein